jgi:hypothetical protein
MAQYALFPAGTLVTYTDGVDTYRDGSRGGSYVIDKTITALGFAGAENTDWENVETLSGGGLASFRDGVRFAAYVIDETLTATGFSGIEDVDWTNVETLEI